MRHAILFLAALAVASPALAGSQNHVNRNRPPGGPYADPSQSGNPASPAQRVAEQHQMLDRAIANGNAKEIAEHTANLAKWQGICGCL